MITRRRFVMGVGTGLVLAGCDGMKPKEGFLGKMEGWNEGAQRALFHPSRRARPESDGSLTTEGKFPTYWIADTMPLAPGGWTLKVGGLVARPMVLSEGELQRLPRTDIRVRHYCVEGWSAVADWHGVRLADLAAHVGADQRARYVDFRSFDAGYWSSWDRGSAFHRQTILAYGMNGKPLGPAHGAPLRLYGAVKLGYKQVKYLTEVNFLDHKTGGYWEDQGYEWYAGT